MPRNRDVPRYDFNLFKTRLTIIDYYSERIRLQQANQPDLTLGLEYAAIEQLCRIIDRIMRPSI